MTEYTDKQLAELLTDYALYAPGISLIRRFGRPIPFVEDRWKRGESGKIVFEDPHYVEGTARDIMRYGIPLLKQLPPGVLQEMNLVLGELEKKCSKVATLCRAQIEAQVKRKKKN